MAVDVFLSYSSKDKPAADAACAVLEAHGIRCWVAPRDILPGQDWGQSIIDAINRCKLMVLIFSSHTNESNQVKREVERVVNRGLTIIPVRIEDVLPAKALEYFLSTPHWLDAFSPPLERHLDHLAASIQQLLSKPQAPESKPVPLRPRRTLWRHAKPAGITLAIAAALGLLAVIALRDRDRPGVPVGPVAAATPSLGPVAPPSSLATDVITPPPILPTVPTSYSPLVGRWKTEMEADGKKYPCLIELKEHAGSTPAWTFLTVTFSDTCPFPLCGSSGIGYFALDGTWAPNAFRPGKDTGTFSIQAGPVQNLTGVYRLEVDKSLVLSYGQRGEIRWQRTASDGPLPNGAAALLPAKIEWPVKDAPGLATRALEYVRDRWQKDAVLLNLELKRQQVLGELADVEYVLFFYSATAEKELRFEPASKTGSTMTEQGEAKKNPFALPVKFLDVADAITSLGSRGIQPKHVTEATLSYQHWYDYRDIRGNNAVLPPCPYPRSGFYWVVKTDQKLDYALAEVP